MAFEQMFMLQASYCNSVSDFGIKAVFNSLEFTKYMYGIYFTCILMSLTLKKMNSVK